jgi:N-acetylmuramoyl-L-alanine amidase
MYRQLDRSFLKAVLLLSAFFLLLTCASLSHADNGWRLWMDQQDMGLVPVYSEGGLYMVSIGTMARSLGFSLFPKDGDLIIKNGTDRVQIMEGTSAVWFNVQIVPMASPPVFRNDRWWIDSRSAIKIMTMLANSDGRSHILQWAGSGTVEERKNVKEQNAPDKKGAEILGGLSEPGQSRLESVRWGRHGNAIRVVLDVAGGSIPQPQKAKGQIKVSFDYSPKFKRSELNSPEPSIVTAALTHMGTNMDVIFRHNGPVLQTLVLHNPDRLVIDFGPGNYQPVQLPTPERSPEEEIFETVPSPDQSSNLVVLDPGHGGKDPGAVANGFREKDLNLEISRKIARNLKSKGIPVRLTRNDDRYLKLGERTDLANKWNAGLFVSIHANALPPGRHATGMEIYLMALPTDKDAMQLALIENKELGSGNSGSGSSSVADERTRMLLNILGSMQQNAKIDQSTTVAEILYNRGETRGLNMRRVAQAPFYVLRGAGMPAVLIETGFLTEAREARMLASDPYQEKLAAALADGIKAFLDKQ